eukprot:IDg16086t1
MTADEIKRSPEAFTSHIGEAAYVSTCSRSDTTCAVNKLAQVIADEAEKDDYKKLYDVFIRFKSFRYELNFDTHAQYRAGHPLSVKE